MKDYKADLGLQLYTLRELLTENLTATLQEVVKAGYTHVETMDTRQLAALKPICDDLGLGIKSSFYNWAAVTGRWELQAGQQPNAIHPQPLEEMIEVAQKLGITELVFGYMLPEERATIDDYELRAEQLNRAGELVKSAGIQHCYHHHSFEFAPLGPKGKRGWDVLLAELDAEITKFEIDVFWASIAGENPVDLIRSLGSSLHLLHLKDIKAGTEIEFDEHNVPADAFLEVGEGILDFKAILEAAQQASVAYCIVEQDQSLDPIASIRKSRKFLS